MVESESVRGLQDSGVQIRRFEVLAPDEGGRDLEKEQTQQESLPQQQDADSYAGQSGGPTGSGWAGGEGDWQRRPEDAGPSLPPIGEAEDHINMLA